MNKSVENVLAQLRSNKTAVKKAVTIATAPPRKPRMRRSRTRKLGIMAGYCPTCCIAVSKSETLSTCSKCGGALSSPTSERDPHAQLEWRRKEPWGMSGLWFEKDAPLPVAYLKHYAEIRRARCM